MGGTLRAPALVRDRRFFLGKVRGPHEFEKGEAFDMGKGRQARGPHERSLKKGRT